MQLSNQSNHVFVIFAFVASDVLTNEKSQKGRIKVSFPALLRKEQNKSLVFLSFFCIVSYDLSFKTI